MAGTDGRLQPNIVCFNCNRRGHYAPQCPFSNVDPKLQNHIDGIVEDSEDITIGFTHTLHSRTHQKEAVLLDTGSNCSVFNNRNLLTDIKKSNKVLRAYSNGGYQDSHYVGKYRNVFEVWYNKDSLVNILSLAEVRKKYRVTMDSSESNTLVVHISENDRMNFYENENGLYLLGSKSKNSFNYSCINLVDNNKLLYTKREVKAAEQSRLLYRNCNKPGYARFFHMLNNNFFRNCPITADDMKRAIHIFGKDIGIGKGTRVKPKPIYDVVRSPIPQTIKELHSEISISIDYVKVQGVIFLHSISSRSYQFHTLEPLFKAKANHVDIINGIKNIINSYWSRGITITQINADNEFNCAKYHFTKILFNIVAAEEHVGDIERANRTLKDNMRTIINDLPFSHYPKAMVAGCAMAAIHWMNWLPKPNGLSKSIGPETLITGIQPPYFQTITEMRFGDYALVDNGKTTNEVGSRRIGAIALFPTKNTSNSWYFMSLITGKVIHRYNWDILPAEKWVLKRVKELAVDQNQPNINTVFLADHRSEEADEDPSYDINQEEVCKYTCTHGEQFRISNA